MSDDHQAPSPASPSMSPTSDGSASTSETEVQWLRRCLPVFVQPQVDVDNHNDLVKVFFSFERSDATGELLCKLCVVFAGESSYNRMREHAENTLATLCYRTFNRRTYKRTADINYMEFRCVRLCGSGINGNLF